MASINTTLPIGQTTTPSVTIKASDLSKTVTLSFDMTHWIAGTTLQAQIQLFIGGAWKTYAQWTTTSPAADPVDNPTGASFVKLNFQNVLPDTQMQGIVTITGNPFQTTITATAV